jgi:hypothetical protein
MFDGWCSSSPRRHFRMAGLSSATRIRTTVKSPESPVHVSPAARLHFAPLDGDYRLRENANNTLETLLINNIADRTQGGPELAHYKSRLARFVMPTALKLARKLGRCHCAARRE